MKGIYALEIILDKDLRVNVGALGEVFFKKGNYVYVGSAQKNLESRIRRHLKKEKKLFWHIDYLLNNESAKVTKVLYEEAGKEGECRLAKDLERQGEPVGKFGSSDCRCKSHLFSLKNSFNSLALSTHLVNLPLVN